MSDRNDELRSLYCGNLSDKVTEELLYELFLQSGPVESVFIPKDNEGSQKTFGFVTFKHEESVAYTLALLDGVTLFGRTLNIKPRTGNEMPYNPYSNLLMHQRTRSCPSNYNNYSRSESRQRGYDSRQNLVNEDHLRMVQLAQQGKQRSLQPWTPPMNQRQDMEIWSTFNRQIGLMNQPMVGPQMGYQQIVNQQVSRFYQPMVMPMGSEFSEMQHFAQSGRSRHHREPRDRDRHDRNDRNHQSYNSPYR